MILGSVPESMSTPSQTATQTQSMNTNMASESLQQKARPTSIFTRQHAPTSAPRTITPASTPSRDSFSAASSPMGMVNSVPTSPEGPTARQAPGSGNLAPLSLPRSPLAFQPSSPPTAMSDAVSISRSTGLIRRLSRGASRGANNLRRRQSTNNIRKHRDQSSGPLIHKNPGSVIDGAYDVSDLVSDLELDTGDDHTADESNAASVFATPSASTTPPEKLTKDYVGSDGALTIPLSLLQGSTFQKITHKKRKTFRFQLEQSSYKILWSQQGSSSKKAIYVDDIREIRAGEAAKDYIEEFQMIEFADRWFTLIYVDPVIAKGRSTKSMHLIAPDSTTRDQWKGTLQFLIKYRGDLMAESAGNSERHRKEQWDREMKKKATANGGNLAEEAMDFAEVKKMCQSFSIRKPESALRSQFEAIDEKGSGVLNLHQFLKLFRQLTERKDIKEIFDSIKPTTSSTLPFEQFLGFLRSTQGVDTESEYESCRHTFARFTTQGKGLGLVLPGDDAEASKTGMTLEAFRDFLSSNANVPFASQRTDVTLERPLNEYFISSSHNTYLMGRQFGGESSSEGYVEALQKGCRCVEIDCWDGSDGKPTVTHGRTFSSRVAFLDCIKAINRYAFAFSPYPLFLSLEVHCNPEQQRIMSDIMKEQFGEKLIQAPLDDNFILPSPEKLKHRILVKVKEPKIDELLPPPANPAVLHRRQRSASAPDPRHVPDPRGIPPPNTRLPSLGLTSYPAPVPPTPLRSSTYNSGPRKAPRALAGGRVPSISGSSSDEESELEADVMDDRYALKKSKPRTSNIVKPLGDLGVYARGIKFSDFRASESKTYNHIFSFNEATFESRCKTAEMKALLEQHNARYLMRVYPKGSRVLSTNMDPLHFWRRGVQMVATNWQTHDIGTEINDAMFAAGNDRTGYVLKPRELRRSETDQTLPGGSHKIKKKLVKFNVGIISAQYLEDLSPRDMNPYVEFEMYSADDRAKGIATGEGGRDASARGGRSGLGSPLRKRTHIVEGNGYDPAFNESITVTLETKYPSLVFVRWTVWNSPDGRSLAGNKPFAHFTAKLSSLQQGYRHLPLYDQKGEPLLSRLFCRVQKDEIRDVELPPLIHNGDGPSPLDTPRASDDSTGRSGKDFLRRVFQRTPSERKRNRDREGSGYFSRTSSVERGY